jgi:hypothetical protein
MKHIKLFEQFVNDPVINEGKMTMNNVIKASTKEYTWVYQTGKDSAKTALEINKKLNNMGIRSFISKTTGDTIAIPTKDLKDAFDKVLSKYSDIKQFAYSDGTKVDKKLFETFIGEGVTFGKKGIKSKLEDKLEIAQQAIDKWGDSYQGEYDRVAKAAKTGKIDVNNIFYIQGSEPQNDYEIFNGISASQLASEIHKVLKKYKKYEVEGSSIPAMAGWSGTMKSTVGGGIDGHVNFNNGKNTYLIAVTVGGGVDRSIREKIFQEVYELMFIFDEYNQVDGGVSIHKDSGTNYHTLGIRRKGESFVRSFANRLQQTINLG